MLLAARGGLAAWRVTLAAHEPLSIAGAHSAERRLLALSFRRLAELPHPRGCCASPAPGQHLFGWAAVELTARGGYFEPDVTRSDRPEARCTTGSSNVSRAAEARLTIDSRVCPLNKPG